MEGQVFCSFCCLDLQCAHTHRCVCTHAHTYKCRYMPHEHTYVKMQTHMGIHLNIQYTCIHTPCMHTHTYSHMHTQTCIQTHPCKYTETHMHTCVHMHTQTHTYRHTYAHTKCTHMCTHTHTYTQAWTHIHTQDTRSPRATRAFLSKSHGLEGRGRMGRTKKAQMWVLLP